MKTTKILHIMSSYGGGISSFIYNKALEMSQYHIQFDVATYSDCPPSFQEAVHTTGGQIFQLKNPKVDGYKAFKQSFLSALLDDQYDVVHCHISGYRSEAYYRLVKKYSEADFYIHAHTALTPGKPWFNKLEQYFNRKNSKAFLGCGIKAVNNVFGDRVSEEEMVIIPNSIPLSTFMKDEASDLDHRKHYRSQFGIKESDLLIGHIGRLTPVKNHALTLDIAEQIKETESSAKIIITGGGDLHDWLETEIRSRQVFNQVQVSGRISPISNYYPALDVLILPSFAEGLPTVVVEAQAAGVPVVMSDQVTDEVDLDLGMVTPLSLNLSTDQWLDTIIEMSRRPVPSQNQRKEMIEKHHYSNETAGQVYANFFK